VPLTFNPNKVALPPLSDQLQIALKTNELNIVYYSDSIHLEALMLEGGSIDTQTFLDAWKTLSGPNEASQQLPTTIMAVQPLTDKLKQANIFLMAHRQVIHPTIYLICPDSVDCRPLVVVKRWFTSLAGPSTFLKF